MIIDAKSIVITLVIVAIAAYGGLQFIRKFALQIAQENHDAIRAMDAEADETRLKKERQAESATESAFAKVKPILTQDKDDEKGVV